MQSLSVIKVDIIHYYGDMWPCYVLEFLFQFLNIALLGHCDNHQWSCDPVTLFEMSQ